ncbi:GmhA Phosphoheptose isomerase [Candidatus Nanopelagicaceae bacterium]
MSLKSIYLPRLTDAFTKLDAEKVLESIALMTKKLDERRTIFIIGNGGSAATASHFAIDLGKTKTKSGMPGSAISLCDNSSIITAVANDNSFEKVFSSQLEMLGKSGDLLISISASGKSPNLVQAVEYANASGIDTLSLVGFDGGKLKEISSLCLHVPTELGDYGIAEDAHSVICHFITEQLRKI